MAVEIGTVVYLVSDKYGLQDIGWVIEKANGLTGPYFWPVAMVDPSGPYPRAAEVPWIMPPLDGDERVRYGATVKDFDEAVVSVVAMNAELVVS